jgi:hypothetical protein
MPAVAVTVPGFVSTGASVINFAVIKAVSA